VERSAAILILPESAWGPAQDWSAGQFSFAHLDTRMIRGGAFNLRNSSSDGNRSWLWLGLSY
jgi:hypothetical protein